MQAGGKSRINITSVVTSIAGYSRRIGIPMIHRRLRVRSRALRQRALKFVLLIVPVASLAWLAACSRGSAEGPQGPPTMPVKVQAVQSEPIGDPSEAVAHIQ